MGVLSKEFVQDVYSAFVQGSQVREIFTSEFCLVRPYISAFVYTCLWHAYVRACVCWGVCACMCVCFRIIEV